MANEDQTLPNPISSNDPTVTSTGAPVPAFRDEIAVSDFGNYQILGEIARGGVGVVYRAKQRGLGRVVALKVLQGGTTASSEQVRRFFQEAQSAAKLQHPHIVPIHDFGTQDGMHYFTMDFIEGHSLADRMVKGPIPTREALEIVKQVSDALHYAHEHGVVHRDIKPGNILLDKEGRVKVTDFGLAKELNGEQMQLTMTGQVMGTPRYMSPEQASGKTALADQRSDIFSLGVTMYEMLTGQSAFEAENVMQMLHKVCHEDPPAPNRVNSKVHRDAATICMKAMEKEPAQRYPSSQDMTLDIERFLAGEPIEAKTAGPMRRILRKTRQYSKLIAINLVIAAFGIYLFVFYLNSRPSLLQLRVPNKDFDVILDDVPVAPEQLGTEMKLKAGKHHVMVAAEPDYDPQELQFVTEPAESRTLSIGLERRKGKVVVEANPPDAAITILGPNGYRAPLRGPRVEQELPTGPYAVLVHRENYLARDIELTIKNHETNTYNIVLPPINVWSVLTSAGIQSVPVVCDVDGNGSADVMVGNNAGHVYCVTARSGVTRWVHRLGDAVQAPLAATVTDSNQTVSVFAGTTGGKLYRLGGGDGRELWAAPYDAGGSILGAILLRDINHDSVMDAIGAAGNGNVFAVSGVDGSALWTATVKGRVESAVALARVGSNEVVLVGTASKTLSCFRVETGELLWTMDVGAPLLFPPRFEVLSGQPVALFPTPKGLSDISTMTAVSLSDHKVLGVSDRFPRPIDFLGNGQAEQLVVTEAGTTCYASDGTNKVWSSEYAALGAYTADMDGDGVLDLVFNNGPDEIMALSGKDGSVIGRMKLDSSTGRGFTLDDVDRDGTPDVIVGGAQRLYCFSLNGGRKLWSTRDTGFFDAPFVEANGKFFTKNDGGEIAAYLTDSSNQVWRVKTSPQPSPYPGLAAAEGVVVDADEDARTVRAFRADNGKILWQMALPTKSDQIGAPAVGAGLAIVGDGVAGVYAFNLTNGTTQWSVGLSNVTTAAAIGGGCAILTGRTDTNYTMYCLSVTHGESRWQAGFSDPFPTAPVMVDIDGDGVLDVIGLCDNGFTYALNGKTGAVIWKFKHSETRLRTGNGIVLADMDGDGFPEGVIATTRGEIVCLDLKTGTARWTQAIREPVSGLPVVGDMNGDGVPDVLVGTMKGQVRCLSGKGNGELWSYDVISPMRYSVPFLVKPAKGGAPLVIVGTGPPENGLYCLRGDCPRLKDRGWSGPWKEVAGFR